MKQTVYLDKIPEAIKSISQGEIVIVVDDENRENEGDFICAAELITPEIINFMSKEGRGLICVPLVEKRCTDLKLPLMVNRNTALHNTPFTISVDLIGNGCTTGISASDRAKTIHALIDEKTHPEDLARPGHIFPLRAKYGGVLRRVGHTEAAIDLARLAGLKPAGVLVEIMNKDGSMARLPDLKKIADRYNLKLISIQDLISHRLERESLIEKELETKITTDYGQFQLIAYRQIYTDEIHLVLKKGHWTLEDVVLVRVSSSSKSIPFLEHFRRNFLTELTHMMQIIQSSPRIALLYINKNQIDDNILHKLKNYHNHKDSESYQIWKMDPKMDEKDYGIGAQILRDLKIHKMKLLTNHPKRRVGLIGYGLEVVDIISL